MTTPFPCLALYAQPFEHADADIVGNHEGLTALRNAIDAALAGGEGHTEAFVAADGEGYTTCVRLHEAMEELRVPYTDPASADHGDSTRKWPHELGPAVRVGE